MSDGHWVAALCTARRSRAVGGPPLVDLIALDEALETLATLDARKVRVIELRFFAGLTVEETADVLEVSPDTVARDWRMARTWLLRQLDTGSSHDRLWRRPSVVALSLA